MEKKRLIENKTSLKLFKKIDKLNFKFIKKYGKINLISIFFLDIQKYLSSSYKSKLYKIKSKKKIKFPFIDLNYLNKNNKLIFNLNNKINKDILDDDLSELNSKIFKVLNLFSKSEHGVYMPNSHIYDYIKSKNINNIKKIYFDKIFLENIDFQILHLKQFLNKFVKEFKIKNSYYTSNFLDWIKLFLSNNKKDNKVTTNKLLIGTNMNIKSRIMSAKYLINKKEVFSFAHANYSSLVYDDPVNECGEFSFCTKYFSNGNIKFKKKHIKSNLCKPKKIIYRKILKRNFISSQNSMDKSLYIPNSYNSYRRYGYYRDLDDNSYLMWQKKLIRASKNIFLKRHPKSRFNYNLIQSNKVLDGKVFDYLKKYDLFIFDIISQPFFEVAQTNNKILYLDINQRLLDKKVIKLIRKRAYVVKCNLNKIKSEDIKKIINSAKSFRIKSFDILNI